MSQLPEAAVHRILASFSCQVDDFTVPPLEGASPVQSLSSGHVELYCSCSSEHVYNLINFKNNLCWFLFFCAELCAHYCPLATQLIQPSLA